MIKIKNVFFVLLSAAFISVMAGCGNNSLDEDYNKSLDDLKAEVEYLQSKVNAKQDEKSQLQKQIADKDAKIKKYLDDIAAVQKRCP